MAEYHFQSVHLESCDGKVIDNGFRIFSHTDKGEKPDAEDRQYSYRVRL